MMTQTGTVQTSQQPIILETIPSSSKSSPFSPYLEKAFPTEPQTLTDTSAGDPLSLIQQNDESGPDSAYPELEAFTLKNENVNQVNYEITALSQNIAIQESSNHSTFLQNNPIPDSPLNEEFFPDAARLARSLESSIMEQGNVAIPDLVTEDSENIFKKERTEDADLSKSSPDLAYSHSEKTSLGTFSPGISSAPSEGLKKSAIEPEVNASRSQVYDSSDKLIPKHVEKWPQTLSSGNVKETIPIIKSPSAGEDFLLRNVTTITDSSGNIIQPPPLSTDGTLSLHLQKLVHNGNETDTVVIQGTIVRNSSQTTIKAEKEYERLAADKLGERLWKSDTPGQQTHPLRQNILGQYFEAKAHSRDHNSDSPQFADSLLKKETDQHSISTLPQNIQDSADSLTNPQYTSHSLQAAPGQLAQSSPKAMFLSSGMIVYEEDIIQQMVDKFQLIKQPSDTRLTMKLHPEELGELRINLTVHEGSIKANVLAQSHQIQQIVERHLPKLKDSLVAQGYTIDEILVTSQSDSVADFSFFEQQLSQRNNDPDTVPDNEKASSFNTIIEDVVQNTTHSALGFNIRA